MRIFNGTKKALTLPYTGGETLTIPAHQPSGNVLCSPEFLSSVITAYNADEIAVIASGPFEISACANIPTAVNYVVQSLDEAIARFNPDAKKVQEMEKTKAKEEPADLLPKKKEEPKVEEPKPEVKPEEEKKPEEPKAEEPKKPELKPETVKKAKKEQPEEKKAE
jgi:outer membrane biosynthesis protein TonB